MRGLRLLAGAAATLLAAGSLAACTTDDTAPPAAPTTPGAVGHASPTPDPGGSAAAASPGASSPGTPAGEAPYAHTGVGQLTGPAKVAKPLVYVPEQRSGSVQVIDPTTYQVISTVAVAASPEHVVPSHDLTTLWVNSDAGNTLTPFDPATGKAGTPVPVADPYNLYFTPDGSAALVMAERLRQIDVRDPHTMALRRSLPVPCLGLNHLDDTADLQTAVASCEFGGTLVVVDADATKVVKTIDLNAIATPGATSPQMARSMGGPAAQLHPGASSMPQDVRLSPDGRWILVADMLRNGVWVINAQTLTYDHFVPTGLGAHGIYPSRDATSIYVSNRDEGSVSVLDATTLTVTATWKIPGGGSPDMGGVTADGKELWLSGRYSSAVYVFDTTTGALTHTIPVRAGPHGLLVWPQPGRFSLGHTGNMR